MEQENRNEKVEAKRPICRRQGELLFIPVKVAPEVREHFLQGKDLGKCIREGEQSGHKHEITTGTLVELQWTNGVNYVNGENVKIPAGEMFLTADNQIKITHPEHDTLSLDKGDYVIRVQREYDEVRDRQVRD